MLNDLKDSPEGRPSIKELFNKEALKIQMEQSKERPQVIKIKMKKSKLSKKETVEEAPEPVKDPTKMNAIEL